MPHAHLKYLAAVCLLTALAIPACAQQLEKSDKPLATIDGEPVTDADLDIDSKLMELRQEAYQARLEGLGNFIARRILEKEASKHGISGPELLEREVDAKVAEPTDAQVEAFYAKQKGRINKPLEDIRPQIVTFLKNQQLNEARNEYIDGLKKGSEIQVLLTPPRVVVEAGESPRRGSADAPVTIVEFSDFQCPYCRSAQPTLVTLLDKYPGKVSLVYKDLPLRQMHPEAQKAAEAARCAGDQGKFWEYHDALFEISRITKDDFGKIATSLELDSIKFAGCLDSGKHESTIESDFEQAKDIGAQSTPVFYVNGIQLKGAQPVDAFSQVIEAELTAAGSE